MPSRFKHQLRRGAVTILSAFLGTIVAAQQTSAQSIDLAWDRNMENDLAGYRVYVGTASRSYSQSYEISTDQTTFAYLNPTPGRRYYFAVSAYNVAGLESGLSNEVSAVYQPGSLPTVPDPLSPAGAITTQIPSFTWKAVRGASGYEVRVDDSTGLAKIHGIYTAEQAGCSGKTATGTCVVSPGVVLVGAAQWRIRSHSAAGQSQWSLPLSFSTRTSSGTSELQSPSVDASSRTPITRP